MSSFILQISHCVLLPIMYDTRNSKKQLEVQSNAALPTATTDAASKKKIIQDRKASKSGRNFGRTSKKCENQNSQKENQNKSKKNPKALIENKLKPLKPSNAQTILTRMQLSGEDEEFNVKKSNYKEYLEDFKNNERNLNRKCKKVFNKKIAQESQAKTSRTKKTPIIGKHPHVKSSNAQKFLTQEQSLEPKKIKRLKIEKSSNEGNLDKLIKNKRDTYTEVKCVKGNCAAKRKNFLPHKSNSEKFAHHVPIWAVPKLLPKQNKKRSRLSDIYDIDRDEDLMNDIYIKKKKTFAPKIKVLKPKVSKKKAVLPLANKIRTYFQEVNEPNEKLVNKEKIVEIADGTETKTVTQTICQPDKKCENSNYDFNDVDLNPKAFEALSFDNNIEMTVEVHENLLQDTQPPEVINDVENCVNECISSFYNFDTSLSISSVFNNNKSYDIDKTPVKQISDNTQANTDAQSVSKNQLFLVPQMTSTPDRPFNDPANICPKVSSTLLPNMSSIPGSAFRNIYADLSGSELLSPFKSSSNVPEIILLDSPCDKDKKDKFKGKTYSTLRNKAGDALETKPAITVYKKSKTVMPENLVKHSKKKMHSKDRKNVETLDDNISLKENRVISHQGQKTKSTKSPLKQTLTENVKCIDTEGMHNIDGKVASLINDKSSSDKPQKMKKKPRKEIHSERAVLKSSSKNDDLLEPIATENNSNIYEVSLFESPIKEPIKKQLISPIKKINTDWFEEDLFSSPEKSSPFSSPLKTILEEKVLKPRKSYSSPHQIRHPQIKKKTNVEQKKKPILTKVDKFIEDMNKHFSEVENTELCIA
ncbi:uncharacterized protein NPIL_397501 [Nephila pilipes]|uniref:Uncharacterized protein n=1 Tax=Nephila pilipes TaxID=299642 RepID=A0A8X6NI39_NEPPI|nr:uncharacterized protein NPIL_397501 [Nephila pilipes]